MSESELVGSPEPRFDARFRTTRWSMVLAAGDRERGDSSSALAELCNLYWLPVYVFVRRRIADVHEAQDLTQAFFARLLEKNYLLDADRRRGRFRTFLLTAVHHFLANERAKAHARKRGGGQPLQSLDFDSGERHCSREPAAHETPEQAFDRQWALQLLELVEARLRDEYARSGNERYFLELFPLVARADDAHDYRDVGARMGISAGAVKSAVYRLRRRYREVLRGEIAQTVACAEEVDDEVRSLFEALG